MYHQAYEAFNRLARRFHDAVGAEGPVKDNEAEELVAEYINVMIEHLSDETLSQVLDEFRVEKERIQNTVSSVKTWLEEEADARKQREFQHFINELHSKIACTV